MDHIHKSATNYSMIEFWEAQNYQENVVGSSDLHIARAPYILSSWGKMGC